MRRAGTLPSEEQARRLADFLLTLGIATRVDSGDEVCAVWIVDEKYLEQGREELARFLKNPDDARYDDVNQAADTIRQETVKKHRQQSKNIIEVRDRWQRPLARRAPVTFVLMAVSIGVFILTYLDESRQIEGLLLISTRIWKDQISAPAFGLIDIQNGQIWRVVTPIFLHGDILHIGFNMWMTYFFGTQIESRSKPWWMIALVLATAIPSNLGQYFVAGPAFGGMSGVVYGLFGFVWMKAQNEPWSGYYLHRSTVIILVGWFFVCLLGLMPNIANTAHAVGLGVGILIGIAPTAWRRLNPPGK